MATPELTQQQSWDTPHTVRSPALERWRNVCALMLLGVPWSAMIVDLVPGGSAFVRGVLHLALTAAHNPPPTMLLVASIAANNTLHSVWPCTLGLLGTQRRRSTRMIANAVVLANLAVPAILVSSALGAYGTRLLPYIPNIPIEFAGIAAGATGWLIEREQTLTTRERAHWIALNILLLVCAAIVETYLVPHR